LRKPRFDRWAVPNPQQFAIQWVVEKSPFNFAQRCATFKVVAQQVLKVDFDEVCALLI
jgi:hypothetical protein